MDVDSVVWIACRYEIGLGRVYRRDSIKVLFIYVNCRVRRVVRYLYMGFMAAASASSGHEAPYYIY
jgi:hypothetical protein